MIDLEGFIRLTEELGGVTVENATAFSSHGFDYPEGSITIKGERALWFVRERHQCLEATSTERRTNAT